MPSSDKHAIQPGCPSLFTAKLLLSPGQPIAIILRRVFPMVHKTAFFSFFGIGSPSFHKNPQGRVAMRLLHWTLCLSMACFVFTTGCANSPMIVQGQLQKLEQQQIAAKNQNQQLLNRSNSLDKDNQQLSALLAQSRQRTKILDDQLVAMRDQLSGLTSQLARLRADKTTGEQKIKALSASLKQRGSVSIKPNNSYHQALPVINISGVHVRRDGELIRIELPGSQLFEPGTTRLKHGAIHTIVSAASEAIRSGPRQIIAIEGHTDSAPVGDQQWQNSQQLSVGRAMAVYNVVVRQAGISPAQLFVVGHGANHPVASNATTAGQQRNRRVELVIYPDQVRS